MSSKKESKGKVVKKKVGEKGIEIAKLSDEEMAQLDQLERAQAHWTKILGQFSYELALMEGKRMTIADNITVSNQKLSGAIKDIKLKYGVNQASRMVRMNTESKEAFFSDNPDVFAEELKKQAQAEQKKDEPKK
jgi:orotate phosphoribosyltransferase-like protein